MTIERFIRRGQFPILTERPLDESETTAPASAKVYVVEVGAYSDRYIDAIFTTRELAESLIDDRQRRAFERNGQRAYRRVKAWRFTSLAGEAINVASTDAEAIYEDVPAETFEAFLARHTWNEFGTVEEYDLWDVLPVVRDG